MKYQIESGIQLIRRPHIGRKVKKATFPLQTMKVGDSIVIEKNFTAVGKPYSKRYNNTRGRIDYIKKKFNVEGTFKVGIDKDMNLRILKIN